MDLHEVFSVIFSFVGSLFLVCLAVLLGIITENYTFISSHYYCRAIFGPTKPMSNCMLVACVPSCFAENKMTKKKLRRKCEVTLGIYLFSRSIHFTQVGISFGNSFCHVFVWCVNCWVKSVIIQRRAAATVKRTIIVVVQNRRKQDVISCGAPPAFFTSSNQIENS